MYEIPNLYDTHLYDTHLFDIHFPQSADRASVELRCSPNKRPGSMVMLRILRGPQRWKHIF